MRIACESSDDRVTVTVDDDGGITVETEPTEQKKVPFRFVSMTRSQTSSLGSPRSSQPVTPAQLTSTSTPPQAAPRAFTVCCKSMM